MKIKCFLFVSQPFGRLKGNSEYSLQKCKNNAVILAKQGRKRPLDTPKRMIKRREREEKRERERQKERYREGGRDKREGGREGERERDREGEKGQRGERDRGIVR